MDDKKLDKKTKERKKSEKKGKKEKRKSLQKKQKKQNLNDNIIVSPCLLYIKPSSHLLHKRLFCFPLSVKPLYPFCHSIAFKVKSIGTKCYLCRHQAIHIPNRFANNPRVER